MKNKIIKGRVTAIMLTYKRFEQMKNAVQMFLNQTHEDKELIILNTGSQSYKKIVSDFVKKMDSKQIIYIEHKRKENEFLADLHNIALQFSSGEYFCRWDDDDMYSINRIKKQFDYCEKLKLDLCLFKNFTIKLNNENFRISHKGFFEPSLFVRNLDKYRYPHVTMCEDTMLVNRIARINGKCGVMKENDFNDYTYVHNGDNICDKTLFQDLIKLNDVWEN